MESKELLKLPMNDEYSGAKTLGEYLKLLLLSLWQFKDEFSGKRPFGNSLWEYDVYICLAENTNLVGGVKDKDGFWEDIDLNEANKVIFELINECFNQCS